VSFVSVDFNFYSDILIFLGGFTADKNSAANSDIRRRLGGLNTAHYKIVKQRIYQSQMHNIDELKQRLLHVWHGIDHSIVDNTIIGEWCGRLRACVRTDSGHIEQLL